MSALTVAATGMNAQSQNLEVIANNIQFLGGPNSERGAAAGAGASGGGKPQDDFSQVKMEEPSFTEEDIPF